MTNLKKNNFAILGAGASSIGTYLGLKKLGIKDENITLYNSDKLYKISENNSENLNEEKIYSFLKSEFGFKIINKKFDKFNYLNKLSNSKNYIWDSNFSYGLTNFWGGAISLFEPKVQKKVFGEENYYSENLNDILQYITITKHSDDIYWDNLSFFNRPEIKIHRYNKDLIDLFYGKGIKSGINSVALETNIGKDNSCINCSNCIVGCLSNSFFNSYNFYKNKSLNFINKTISEVNIQKNIVKTKNSEIQYEKIFFNLGVYNTQKVSNIGKGYINVKDSKCYIIPIISLKENFSGNYFGLTNNIVNIELENEDFCHIQFYPPLDHFYKSLVPFKLWNLFYFLNDIFFRKLIFARVYFSDDVAGKKKFYHDGKTDKINTIVSKSSIEKSKLKLNKIIKSKLDGSKYKLLPFFIESETSSHYSGYDINYENLDKFNIKKKVYFNDSTLWQTLPSNSPTASLILHAYTNTLKNF